MNIYFFSTSVFADNQLPLLNHLNKSNKVIYGVLFPIKNSNFSVKEVEEYCHSHDIEFHPFILNYRFRDPRTIKTYIKALRSIFRTKPDIIFIANFNDLYFNLFMTFLPNRKTIIGIHDVINHTGMAFNKIGNFSKIILFKRFKYFLTYSNIQASHLIKRVPNKLVFTIPLPLIEYEKRKMYKSYNIEEIIFLFFGNIIHYKGLDILLQSINRISEEHNNFKLIIAGRCTNWQTEYEPLILYSQHVEKHIRFIRNEEISAFFSKSDYLILPYRDATQSGPLMIAYNYGVPVLSSYAIGNTESFSNGQSGYIFDILNPQDIDRVLIEAIKRTKEEYIDLVSHQSEWIKENFSYESIVKKYNDMFSAIV